MLDVPTGLTSLEAQRRLHSVGPNAIVDVAQHPVCRAMGKLWSPVPWMLEAAILLELGLGEFVQAGFVAVLLVFNAGLGFVQESRARATLEALKSRLALVASVRRDGAWQTVPASDLVPGDVVKLSLGGVVAADVRLIEGSILLDQSMLTGESVPVEAVAGIAAFSGALVRGGEALGEVTATGEHTKFGKTAELVRGAAVVSTQQRTVLRIVRNLVLFNGSVTILLAVYAVWLRLPFTEVASLVLVAVLSSIPVALPSMFTLAEAIGARSLARRGVLPTSLSAVDEAAGIDVLCSDKTGTLTRNELSIMAVRPLLGLDEAHVLGLAALASSDGGQDPVDSAIRAVASRQPTTDGPRLKGFVPFDPALKRSEATATQADGGMVRIVKGAFTVVEALCRPSPQASSAVDKLQAKGLRVLAVASGASSGADAPAGMVIVGLIGISDPPRADSADLVAELSDLGVRTVMVTGDAQATAEVVAASVGIHGPVCSASPLPKNLKAEGYAIFAGVLPEDKYALVKALQQGGHIVGMCGDGANDAPALRQAQMGIAVSTATDVAKSAAGIVLTKPGLDGIVLAVKEGRTTFQRILTYTLRSIVHNVVKVLFLIAGLAITGHAILTPTLMVFIMVTGDFLSMSSSTDNVRASAMPNVWRTRNLMVCGIVLGLVDLAYCVGCLAAGKFALRLDTETLRTLAVVTLVFGAQALLYVARERRHIWSSRPSGWMIASSVTDVAVVVTFAVVGVIMAPLPFVVIAGLFAAAVALAFVLDVVKTALFSRLAVA